MVRQPRVTARRHREGRGLAEGEGQANGQAQPARGEPPRSGTRRKDRAERLDEKLAKPGIEEFMEELDEHGVPVVAAPPRKWLAWLLAAVCFAGGVTSVYVSASITEHHLPVRWKTEHYLPEAPAYVAFLLGTVVVLWLGRSNHWEKYGKTERIALGVILGLAMLLGFIGFMILTQQEPYNCCAGG
jgi:hypothetical protein